MINLGAKPATAPVVNVDGAAATAVSPDMENAHDGVAAEVGAEPPHVAGTGATDAPDEHVYTVGCVVPAFWTTPPTHHRPA